MLESIFGTLITSADGNRCIDPLACMQRPIVNNFWVAVAILLVGNEFDAVNEEFNFGLVDGDCVVMEVVVAHLRMDRKLI